MDTLFDTRLEQLRVIPRVALFDLDETLAPSFQAPSTEMLQRLATLLERVPIAIISGAGFDRIERDVLAHMPHVSSNLYVFPNSSSQCYTYHDGAWHMEYNHTLSNDERNTIKQAITDCMNELSVIKETPSYGAQIIDREAQIAFTVVGLDAPKDLKYTWDPTGEKRRTIVDALKAKLDGFDILTGGASTIDITRKDVNKAYGVAWLSKRLEIPPAQMLYIGDALYEGGNDAVVIPTGIQTRMVSGPDETAKIVDKLLQVCSV